MATLQQQIEKAKIALSQAKNVQSVKEFNTRDTRYGKFNPESPEGKAALAELTAASKKVKEAQLYYDNLQAAFKKEQDRKAITGEDTGISEEKQAANEGLTVEELRAKKQAALDADKAKQDAANQDVVDQKQQATYSQFINTLVADETQLKAVQADLKRNFPAYYTGGTNGLKDWLKTQSALEIIYTKRGALPKALQAADLRTFLIKPPVEGFGTDTGTGTGAGNVYTTISNATQAASYIKDTIKSELGREATTTEITDLTKKLNDAQKKNPTKVVNGTTTGGLDVREFLTQEIQKLPEFAKKKTDKATITSQSILGTAKANGLTLGQDQINNFTKQVQNGTDIKIIQNQIRSIAANGMPDNIKKLLNEGVDLSTIYAPYKNIMASTLELNPESIDLKDPTLRLAFGPDKETTIYDFEKALRKDYRWQYTDNAKRDVSNVALKVLRDFGFQA